MQNKPVKTDVFTLRYIPLQNKLAHLPKEKNVAEVKIEGPSLKP